MLQLENKGIFHCDLRSQNVLVSQRVGHFIAKLNDFGLSKDIFNSTENENENTTFPIKWTDVQVLNGWYFFITFDLFNKKSILHFHIFNYYYCKFIIFTLFLI